jgi:hypothetical protein
MWTAFVDCAKSYWIAPKNRWAFAPGCGEALAPPLILAATSDPIAFGTPSRVREWVMFDLFWSVPRPARLRDTGALIRPWVRRVEVAAP